MTPAALGRHPGQLVRGRRARVPAPRPGHRGGHRARRDRAGTRLPAERVLAEALAVSRTTVVSAYEELRGQERVESRQGSGTRVRGSLSRGPGLRLREDPVGLLPAPPRLPQPGRRPGRHDRVSRRAPAGAGAARARDRRASTRRRSGSSRAGPGYLPMGLPALRAAIARHLTGWGVADHGRPGARDARRAAGDRAGGRALPRARRHGRRGGPDVPRLDRHLRRPGRAAGGRAGRRRRGVARRACASSSSAPRRG